MTRRTIALALILAAAAALAHAEPVEEAYVKLRDGYRNFLVDAPAVKRSEKWRAQIRGFLNFAEKHAGSPRAPDALFLAGDAYERWARWAAGEANRREALIVYDRLARLYPGAPLATEAMWRAALLAERAGHNAADLCARRQAILAAAPADGEIAAKARAAGDRWKCAAAPLASNATSSSAAPPPNDATPPETKAAPEPAPPAAAPPAAGPTVAVRRAECSSADDRAALIIYLDGPIEVRPGAALNAAGPDAAALVTLVGAALAPEATTTLTCGALGRVELRADGRNVTVAAAAGARPLVGFAVNLLENPWRVTVEAQARAASPSARRVRPLVAVDAGHGGDDWGARSHALFEKQTALTLARLVRERLAAHGAAVVLTRENDDYLPLDARCALANDARADLFVSIHLNASEGGASHGIETYFYRARGERDETVRRENQAGANGAPPPEPAQRAAIEAASRRLARALQKRLLESARPMNAAALDRGVKAAPLYLLSGARMPAALVEVGFATNPAEARLLEQPAYCARLADGIARAVLDYLAAPPEA